MSVPELLVQPLLAVFPHGLQHGARRNARQALDLAAAGRRDRQAAEAWIRDTVDARGRAAAARSVAR